MYEYSKARIEELSGLCQEERDHAARWWARQPELIRVEAVKLSLNKFKRLEKKGKDEKEISEALYAMLTQACRDMWQVEQAKAIQQKGKVDREEAERILAIRAARIRAAKRSKAAKKARQIRLNYRYLIKRLLSEGLSWREIAAYLAKYHRFKVSHSYLRDVWVKIEKAEELPPTQGGT